MTADNSSLTVLAQAVKDADVKHGQAKIGKQDADAHFEKCRARMEAAQKEATEAATAFRAASDAVGLADGRAAQTLRALNEAKTKLAEVMELYGIEAKPRG